MFIFKKKGGGNKYTFISILLILVIIYLFRLVSPQKEVQYPDVIKYNNHSYQYVETVKGTPFMFTRKKPTDEVGHLLLARRGVSVSEEIYIYGGSLKYRRYVVLKE